MRKLLPPGTSFPFFFRGDQQNIVVSLPYAEDVTTSFPWALARVGLLCSPPPSENEIPPMVRLFFYTLSRGGFDGCPFLLLLKEKCSPLLPSFMGWCWERSSACLFSRRCPRGRHCFWFPFFPLGGNKETFICALLSPPSCLLSLEVIPDLFFFSWIAAGTLFSLFPPPFSGK